MRQIVWVCLGIVCLAFLLWVVVMFLPPPSDYVRFTPGELREYRDGKWTMQRSCLVVAWGMAVLALLAEIARRIGPDRK